MTVESDITTALSSYSVRQVLVANYDKPRSHTLARYTMDVHVEHAASSDIPTIVTALEAMTGYISKVARCVSSWPVGDVLYSRFEVELIT